VANAIPLVCDVAGLSTLQIILAMLWSVISVIGLMAALLLVRKVRNTATLLMLAGMAVGTLTYVAEIWLASMVSGSAWGGANPDLELVVMLTHIAHPLSYFAVVLGLLMYANNLPAPRPPA